MEEALNTSIDPALGAKSYCRILRSVACSYRDNNQLDKAIALHEQSFAIAKRYYQKNPDHWAENYTDSLNDLANLYDKNNQLHKAIALREQSLEMAKHNDQQNPDQWIESYTISLNNLADTKLRLEHYSDSSRYFNDFFNNYSWLCCLIRREDMAVPC